MKFMIVGTNHKYSPFALREKLSFSKSQLIRGLNFLQEEKIFRGAVILSTCNRVEIYVATRDEKLGVRKIENFISRFHKIDRQFFSPYLYIYEDKKAVKHLFSVTCGLDSLILGEVQILGQVKFAFKEAQGVFFNEFLEKIFNSAIYFARAIHNQTKISEGKISIGSIAVDFIKEKLGGSLRDKNVLIIGVGKVTELVLKYLKKENPQVVFISNRTFQKAKELAAQIQAKAVKFDRLEEFLKVADVIITATSSPHFVIKKERFRDPINQRLLIIDLALPRDVEPAVGQIRNVGLFYLEDLDSLIKKNLEKKAEKAKKIEEIIDIETEKLWRRLTELEREPAPLL